MLKTTLSLVSLLMLILILAGCGGQAGEVPPTAPENLPEVNATTLEVTELPKYSSLELTVALQADYANPYDAREISLEGTFTAPDGSTLAVPGFWDGESAWKLRFTPWLEGEWTYAVTVQDKYGKSAPSLGSFKVTPSDAHGWIQVASRVDPALSSRYLVYHDGTPFYGIGHCDAGNILADGFSAQEGVGLFNKMVEAGENYVVWWPQNTFSLVSKNYDDYSGSHLNTIDMILRDAEKKGIVIVFTIWHHPLLRDKSHSWGDARWEGYNAFRKLGDIRSFFTSDEAWAWQANLYRYMIARWGYSPAIGLWGTVSEINGTNAYNQTDAWHARVNQFFVENDPYRHPTTASMSGDVDWPEGFQVMDMPQVHLYALEENAIKTAQIVAEWTIRMSDQANKPNWVGEYGVRGNALYPELLHNGTWAALAAGAAMTPADWNNRADWWQMTPEMYADMGRVAKFLEGVPLAAWKPEQFKVSTNDPAVRGWGIASEQGGLFWLQDFSHEEGTMDEIRARPARTGVVATLAGLPPGTYLLAPYNTWQGEFLEPQEFECEEDLPCQVNVPDFQWDMAFKILKK